MHVRDETGEVFAPVAMWMEALDLVIDRLCRAMPVSLSRIRGVSGSGQQHGSVFWNRDAERLLAGLDPKKSLVSQLSGALAHAWSPNWQDQSTQKECDAFDAVLGGRESLADVTGSGAHHVSYFVCDFVLDLLWYLLCSLWYFIGGIVSSFLLSLFSFHFSFLFSFFFSFL